MKDKLKICILIILLLSIMIDSDLYKVNSNILSFLRHNYTVFKVLKSHQVEIFVGKNFMNAAFNGIDKTIFKIFLLKKLFFWPFLTFSLKWCYHFFKNCQITNSLKTFVNRTRIFIGLIIKPIFFIIFLFSTPNNKFFCRVRTHI